jgi:hypothetical protein
MRSCIPFLFTLVLTAAGCAAEDSVGDDDDADETADEEGYDDHDGTGAGADDGDGPDDNTPNDEDDVDVELGADGDLDPHEVADLEEESALPDEFDPYLEPDDATALRLAPAAPSPRPGCVATGTLGGAKAWVFFVRPDAPCRGTGYGKDRNAMAELIRLIRSVPEGGRIDGHIFNISIDQVAKELYQAQKRKVAVYISTDGQVAGSQDAAKTVYLDQLKHIVYCSGSNRACIAKRDKAISHTKLFTFSKATQPDGTVSSDVVWFGSANQTLTSGTNTFNDTVTIYGANGIYKDLRHYLDDLYEQKRTGDYFKPDSGRGYIRRLPANVYISPEAQTDLVNHRLDDLTPGAGCEVRVMQSMMKDNRQAIARRLVKMKEGGCDVRVVSSHPDPETIQRLKAAGIEVRRARVHNKAFIVRGNFAGTTKYRVHTGSHNIGIGATRYFDEIFVKLAPEVGETHPVYDAYVQHFQDAWDGAEPL